MATTTPGAAPANSDIQMAPMPPPEQLSSPPRGPPGNSTLVVNPMDHRQPGGTPQAPPQPVVVSPPPAPPGSPIVIVSPKDSPQPLATPQTPPKTVSSPPPGAPAEPTAVASSMDNPQPRPQTPPESVRSPPAEPTAVTNSMDNPKPRLQTPPESVGSPPPGPPAQPTAMASPKDIPQPSPQTPPEVSNAPMGPVPPPAPVHSPLPIHPGQPIAEGIPVPVSQVNNPQPPETPQTPQVQFSSWSTGLYDCRSDRDTCCLVLWCPCVAFGRMAEILDEGKSSCCCQGTLYSVLHILSIAACAAGAPLTFHFLLTYKYRGKLKQKFNMPPSCREDFCTHFFCEWCALCQEYRELQARGYDPSLGWYGNMEKGVQAAETPTMVSAPVSPSMKR